MTADMIKMIVDNLFGLLTTKLGNRPVIAMFLKFLQPIVDSLIPLILSKVLAQQAAVATATPLPQNAPLPAADLDNLEADLKKVLAQAFTPSVDTLGADPRKVLAP